MNKVVGKRPKSAVVLSVFPKPLTPPPTSLQQAVTLDGKIGLLLPPIAFFLIASSLAHSRSPLNPQNIAVRGPFFQGWLIRQVDHERHLSFIIIIGSFSMKGSSDYTQHYVYYGVEGKGVGSHSVEAFPPPQSVSLATSPTGYLNITWRAEGLGEFRFNNTACCGDFSFPGGYHVDFDAYQRKPWRPSKSLTFAGPEGWLGLTTLLPCHYYVHSVGSVSSYRLTIRGKEVEGKGYCHIEGNHGTFFPEGWTWAQAIQPNNTASFSLVAGKFVIGPMAPLNIVLYLRRRCGSVAVLRTTDLDKIAHYLNGKTRYAKIKGQSLLKGYSLELVIQDSRDAKEHRVHIPTAAGFSDQPGCLETYCAEATLIYREVHGGLEEHYTFPLTAFEFGGSFINSIHGCPH